jgi:hypothetical protein
MIARTALHVSLIFAAWASMCHAQEPQISTKSFVSPGKQGKPDVRCESTYRDKKCILRVFSEKRPSGEFAPYARSFQIGHAMMIESDEDHDGFFETLAVSEEIEGQYHLEVFTRGRDGSVSPVNAQTLAAYKKRHATIAAFFDKVFDKNTDTNKINDLMHETQRKLRDAEKEK